MEDQTERKERGRRRRYPSLMWPLLLIAVGVVALLASLGYVQLNFWELWRLWPVLLILIGLDLLLARRSWLGSLIVVLLTLAVIGGAVWLLVQTPGRAAGGTEVDRISEPLQGAERASLDVETPVGKLTISQLGDSSSLVEGTLDLATSHKPTWKADRQGDQVSMQLGYGSGTNFSFGWGRGETWDLLLSPAVIWELKANLAVGDGQLDLTGLNVDTLNLQLGVGQCVVTLPEKVGGKVAIKGGVGSLVLRIPKTLAAQVTIQRGISPVSAPARFERNGDTYVTSDWETNTSRVEVEINAGIGPITIEEP